MHFDARFLHNIKNDASRWWVRVGSVCNYSSKTIKFDFHVILCNLWLGMLLIARFMHPLILHANIIVFIYLFTFFCSIAEWWKPQRGFARCYWLYSAPRGSFVPHSGVRRQQQRVVVVLVMLVVQAVAQHQQQQQLAARAMPADIRWTIWMHRPYRWVSRALTTFNSRSPAFCGFHQLSLIFVRVFCFRSHISLDFLKVKKKLMNALMLPSEHLSVCISFTRVDWKTRKTNAFFNLT